MKDEDQQQTQATYASPNRGELPSPPPRFSGGRQGGNNIPEPPSLPTPSTAAAAAAAAAAGETTPPPPPPPPPTTTKDMPQQSIEEFAITENSFGNSHQSTLLQPATSINFPMPVADEDQTCVSSISFPFQNADLFVGSLYPSTQGIEALDEAPSNLIPGGTGSSSGVHPRLATTTTTTSTKSAVVSKKQENVVQSTAQAEYNKQRDQEGLEELGQLELSVLQLKQQRDIDCFRSQSYQQANDNSTAAITPKAKNNGTITRHMSLPAIYFPAEENALSGIMPLPRGVAATREEVPRGPGAHSIGTPLDSHNFVAYEETTTAVQTLVSEEPRENTESSCNGNLMGLPTAQPVDSLPEAHVEEEELFGKKQQIVKRGIRNFWGGLITSSPRHWRCVLMTQSSIVMVIWFAYAARRIVRFNNDPGMLRIRQSIEEAFGRDYFDSQEKEMALHWIVHKDPMENLEARQENYPLEEDKTARLIQRFSLVAFYFQTSARQPWSYCNPPQGKQSDVCFVDRSIEKDLPGGTRWLSATHECQWMGLHCERGSRTVSTLRLPNNNVTGAIPSELRMRSNLQFLELQDNNLSGPLPLWINQLTKLQKLNLKRNALTGSITPEFCQNLSITTLSLNYNLLTGQLPHQIGLFGGHVLYLNHNLLTGPIPDETYHLTNLKSLYLAQNRLTGTVSTLVGQLTHLMALDLSHLALTQTLPTEIGLLRRLTDLNLFMTNLVGTIPEELFNLELLFRLDISETKIGGTISSRISELSKLESFHLSKTKIGGTIQEDISLLSKLRVFHADGNPKLSGSVPVKFCTNRFRHHDIVVDCSPSSSSEKPAVVCPKSCCSSCCDVETKICVEQ